MSAICKGLAWDMVGRHSAPQHGDLHAWHTQLLGGDGCPTAPGTRWPSQGTHSKPHALPPQPPSAKLCGCAPSNFPTHSLLVAKKYIKKLFLALKPATVTERIKGAELMSKEVPFAETFPLPSQKHIALSRAIFLFSLSPAVATEGPMLSGHAQAPAG